MEINNFIFVFSLIIFFIGFVTVVLTSRDFKKMSEGEFVGGEETGPRAVLFDKLFKYFSDEEAVPSESVRLEMEQLIREAKQEEQG